MKKINEGFVVEMAEEIVPPVETPPETPPQETPPTNEPPKGDDKPADPPTPPTEDKSIETIKGLETEIERLKGELGSKSTLEQQLSDLQGQLNQLKTDGDTSKNKVAEYESLLNEIVNSKLESVPEKFRELVPKNLSVKEQLAWLNKAETNGLFGTTNTNNELEIGKPFNPKNPGQHVDTAKLSPGTILSMAYGTPKK